jgi:hypothetical protein
VLAAALAVPRLHEAGAPADAYEKVPPPSIQMRISEASATTVPWIDSNAWRYMRGLKKALYAELAASTGALAAAEAHAWGVDALLQPAPEDVAQTKAMLDFIRRIDAPRMPQLANVGIVDDGTEEMAEVLNLLSRRNLLSRVVSKEDPELDLTIRLGSKHYPKSAVQDPNDFAARVREQLGDSKRLLRLFGTYTVLANLTGERGRARLYLVNYSRRPVKDVRVRILGNYRRARLHEAADPNQAATDFAVIDGGTEFTVPLIRTYAVIDLE